MTHERMASRPTGTVAFSISLANVGTSIPKHKTVLNYLIHVALLVAQCARYKLVRRGSRKQVNGSSINR